MDTNQLITHSGFTTLNPKWTKSKKNKEPKFINTSNPTSNDMVDAFYSANIRKPSVYTNTTKYAEMGITPNDIGNLDVEIANRQSNWSKTFNSLAQAVWSETALGTLKAFPDMFDAVVNGFFNSDGDYQNPISNKIEEWQETFRNEVAPIYSDPTRNDILNGGLTNWGWWCSNAPSVLSSLTLLVPSMAVTKSIGLIAKATKVGALTRNAIRAAGQIDKTIESGEKLSKLQMSLAKLSNAGMEGSKLATFGEVGTNALLQRTMENYQEAQGVYKDMYSEALDKFNNMNDSEYQQFLNNNPNLSKEAGSTDKDKIARYVAKKSADEDFVDNFANIGFDVIQLYGLRGFWKGLKDRSGSYNLNKTLREQKLKVGKTAEEIAEAEKNISTLSKIRNSIVDRAKNEKLIIAGELSEGVEESVNYISQMEGMNLGRVLLDDKEGDKSGFDNRLAKYMQSGGLWDSAFWGVMGGVVFHHLGSAFGKVKATFNDRANEEKKKNDKTGETAKRSPFSLAETTETKIRKSNMESWSATFSTFFDRAKQIKDGKNPYSIAEDDKLLNTDEERSAAASKSEDDLITDMAIQAAHRGNLGYLREFIKSDEVRDALVKQGVISESDSKLHQQRLLGKIDQVMENYNQELEKVINIANNYKVTRKDKEIVPFEFLQSIATQNVKYNQTVNQLRNNLSRTEQLINSALSDENIASKLNDVSIDDLQQFASQSLLQQNLAELYAQRNDLKSNPNTAGTLSSLIAIDRINKNIAVIENMLTPQNLRRAVKLAITAKHDKNGTLVVPKLGDAFTGAAKELDDILKMNLLDIEGNEIDTKRKEYLKKLDEYVIKYGISGRFTDYLEDKTIFEQNSEALSNDTKLASVLDEVNGIGIAGTKKSLMDLLLDKTATEMNIDFKRKEIVTNRDELASEISFMNQTMQDARKKVIEKSYKTISDIVRKYKDNRSELSRSIGAAYEGNAAEFDKLISILEPVDRTAFKDAVECLNLSSQLNYRLGLQIEDAINFDESLIKTISPARNKNDDEDDESNTQSTNTQPSKQKEIKPSKPLSLTQPTNPTPTTPEQAVTQTIQQNTNLTQSNGGNHPSEMFIKLNMDKKTFTNESKEDKAEYKASNRAVDGSVLPDGQYRIEPYSNTDINDDELYNGTEKITNGGVVISNPIIEVDDKGGFKIISKGEIGVNQNADSSTGGVSTTNTTQQTSPVTVPPAIIPPTTTTTPPTTTTTPTTGPTVQQDDNKKVLDNEVLLSYVGDIGRRVKKGEDVNIDEEFNNIFNKLLSDGYEKSDIEPLLNSWKKRILYISSKNKRQSAVGNLTLECATQELEGNYTKFVDGFAETVKSFLTEYAKTVNLPTLNGKYYGNFEDLLRYIEDTIPNEHNAEFVYNSLLAYFSTEEGKNTFYMTDSAEAMNEELMLKNVAKKPSERAIEKKAANLVKSFSLDVENITDDADDVNAALEAQYKLRNNDELTLNLTAKNHKQTLIITVNSKDGVVGYLGIPDIDPHTGAFVQVNNNLRFRVGKDASHDDNGTKGLKEILKDIINNATDNHRLLNEIIHKIAFDNYSIADAVKDIQNNELIKNLIKQGIIVDESKLDVTLKGLAKLWAWNYKNKTSNALSDSIDLFYDKLRDSYNQTLDLQNRLESGEEIKAKAVNVSRGELIRAKDTQNTTPDVCALPIQEAIGTDLENWTIAVNDGNGLTVKGKGTERYTRAVDNAQEYGQTRLAVFRENGTVDLVVCYPVKIKETLYTRDGKTQKVKIGEDFNNIVNAVKEQIKDRLNNIKTVEDYYNLIDFINKIFNRRNDSIFDGINTFTDSNNNLHFKVNDDLQVTFYRNSNKGGLPGVKIAGIGKNLNMLANTDRTKLSDTLLKMIDEYGKFSINISLANPRTNRRTSNANAFYKFKGRFIVNIDEFNGKNGIHLDYNSFDDFMFKNNLVRVDLAKDEHGSNYRTINLIKQGAAPTASFELINDTNDDNNDNTNNDNAESHPVEESLPVNVPYSTQILDILKNKSNRKTLDIAKLLITNKTGIDLLNKLNDNDILSRLFSGNIIFDDEYLKSNTNDANAAYRLKDKKIIIGQKFMDIVDSDKQGSNNRAIRILLHENIHRAIHASKRENREKLYRSMQDIYDDFIEALDEDIASIEKGNIDEVINRRHIDTSIYANIPELFKQLKQFRKESYENKGQSNTTYEALEEFIVESFTGIDLMRYLNGIDAKTSNSANHKNAWQKILDFIGKLFDVTIRKGSLREKELISLSEVLNNNVKPTKKETKKTEKKINNTESDSSNLPKEGDLFGNDDTNDSNNNQTNIDNNTDNNQEEEIGNTDITDTKDDDYKPGFDSNDDYNCDDFENMDSATTEYEEFNTYPTLYDAVSDLPMSERSKFIDLINSADISVSCR